jgi:hypothetical protein
MKQQRWLVLSIAMVAVAQGSSGCQPEDAGPFANGTFAGTFENEIRASCRHTTDCNNTPGDYDNCVNNTAGTLERDGALQLRFVTNYTRCALFSRCDFVGCANAPPPVYGESQRTKVSNSCQQKAACEQTAGRPLPNVDHCTAEGIGKLDSWAAAQRQNFEAAYANCQAMAACTFVSCFFAP